jgi:hypothetical protein
MHATMHAIDSRILYPLTRLVACISVPLTGTNSSFDQLAQASSFKHLASAVSRIYADPADARMIRGHPTAFCLRAISFVSMM